MSAYLEYIIEYVMLQLMVVYANRAPSYLLTIQHEVIMLTSDLERVTVHKVNVLVEGRRERVMHSLVTYVTMQTICF